MNGTVTHLSTIRGAADLATARQRARAHAAVMEHHYALPVVVAINRQPTAHEHARASGAAKWMRPLRAV
jgi:hypothetical protein